MVVRLAIAAVIGGGALAAFGWKQERLAVGVRGQPQQLSVSQLEASGYGENRNVVVTDFYALPAFAVQEEQIGSNWESIWVPIIPLECDLALWIDESYERGTAEQDALERNAQFKIIAQVDVKNTAQLDA